MAQDQKEQKERDVGQIIRYLTHTFNQATTRMERPWRNAKTGEPNTLYRLQTEFAYLINEIAMAPRCTLQKGIADCNNFIDQVISDNYANSK